MGTTGVLGQGTSFAGDFDVVVAIPCASRAAGCTNTRVDMTLLAA